MGHPRRERVAEALRNEISDLLRESVRDPRVGFVTLTGVTISPDLTQARIYVTVLGTPETQRESIVALNHAAGFLRREVFRRLRLKKPMELTFHFDEAVASGNRIEELLHQIHHPQGDEEE